MADIKDIPIPLPKFLKSFTDNNIPVSKAMALSAKIYKDYNTPAKLAQLNDHGLVSAGIHNKDDRKTVLAAMRASAYLPKDPRKKIQKLEEVPVPGPSTLSTPSALQTVTTPKRKRKQIEDANALLPKEPQDEAATYGSLDFNEILDEKILNGKSSVVNRAPLMTAWAMIVAERLGFRREEALSIASVYTEMNAVTKGVSLGLFESGKGQGLEAAKDGSQSYIELMGRRPLYRTKTQQWRALSSGMPVNPSTAFSYISRALRQTTPHIVGSLKLLADSFSTQELNNRAWGLYAEFRPQVDKWGARSEVKCSTILDLRKKHQDPSNERLLDAEGIIKQDETDTDQLPEQKKIKITLEDYEASLDDAFAYEDLDLSIQTRDP